MPLVESLIYDGWLKTPRIIAAFKEIKRQDFMPEDMKEMAETNEAFPIGYGQTSSQPRVVAFMLELLDPQEGDKILDIGSGSGWTTALLSHIVGSQGRVTAIEIVPQLRDFGERNVEKYGFVTKGITEFICADASEGYTRAAPYDRILASASAPRIPIQWKRQVKIGGRIVAPDDNSIWLLARNGENEFEETEYRGFSFVPLITRSHAE